MEELRQILKEKLSANLYQIIISNPREKNGVFKIKVRPLLKQADLIFQASSFIENKVLHSNYTKEAMLEEILVTLQQFRQIEIESTKDSIIGLISKKGKITIKKLNKQSNCQEKKIDFSHNRKKQYLLKEGCPIPFMVDLGIQTAEGKIVQAKYDKFKQINRYLEFVEDILPKLEKKEQISIIDFGCGKAYLTFALYYYLTEVRGKDVRMIGLDLKEDVIQICNELAVRYGYRNLEFLQGDIGCYEGAEQVDMVVTLHACDTATDFALEKAVKWNAAVIFSVPCCQHEVNKQIENALLQPVLKYGIIKERMSALLTDALRANMLETVGYDTQILEFIDMEHTPKNLLIRAVKKEENQRYPNQELKRLLKELSIEPTLVKLLQAGEE